MTKGFCSPSSQDRDTFARTRLQQSPIRRIRGCVDARDRRCRTHGSPAPAGKTHTCSSGGQACHVLHRMQLCAPETSGVCGFMSVCRCGMVVCRCGVLPCAAEMLLQQLHHSPDAAATQEPVHVHTCTGAPPARLDAMSSTNPTAASTTSRSTAGSMHLSCWLPIQCGTSSPVCCCCC